MSRGRIVQKHTGKDGTAPTAPSLLQASPTEHVHTHTHTHRFLGFLGGRDLGGRKGSWPQALVGSTYTRATEKYPIERNKAFAPLRVQFSDRSSSQGFCQQPPAKPGPRGDLLREACWFRRELGCTLAVPTHSCGHQGSLSERVGEDERRRHEAARPGVPTGHRAGKATWGALQQGQLLCV